MSLPTNASSRLVQSQDRRNATLISDLGHCAVSHPSYNLHHLSSGVTFWSRAMTHGSHTKMTLEMGTRFFGVTLRTPIVGIKFGSFFFWEGELHHWIIGKVYSQRIIQLMLYQASDGGSNSGSSGWQSQCITRSTEYTVTTSQNLQKSCLPDSITSLWPCHFKAVRTKHLSFQFDLIDSLRQ